jgi:hypothetical protein
MIIYYWLNTATSSYTCCTPSQHLKRELQTQYFATFIEILPGVTSASQLGATKAEDVATG